MKCEGAKEMSKLLINEKPLLVLPKLAEMIGLNESLFIQQLHYWLEESTKYYDGHKWVYNSYESWHKQFPFWSLSKLRRVIVRLEEMDLVISGNFNRTKLDKTKWYRINYDLLRNLYEGLLPLYEPRSSVEEKRETDVNNREDHDNLDNEPSIIQIEPSTNEKSSVQNEQQFRSNIPTREVGLTRAIPETTSETTHREKEIIIINNARKEKTTNNNPFQFFEQNGFGTIGSHIQEKIQAWCIDLSDELVIEAMKRAVETGQKNWKYVEAILRHWVDKGYETVEDVVAAELAYKNQQKQRNHDSIKQEKPKLFVLDINAGEDDRWK